MPSIQVEAQCMDQDHYGNLVEFVHQAQKKAVGNSDRTRLQIEISGGGLPGGHTMKGVHKPIAAQGYIPSIERAHKRFEYAPKFTFGFTVAQSLEGIYQEVDFNEPEGRSWAAILEGMTTFSQAPKSTASTTPVPPTNTPPGPVTGVTGETLHDAGF